MTSNFTVPCLTWSWATCMRTGMIRRKTLSQSNHVHACVFNPTLVVPRACGISMPFQVTVVIRITVTSLICVGCVPTKSRHSEGLTRRKRTNGPSKNSESISPASGQAANSWRVEIGLYSLRLLWSSSRLGRSRPYDTSCTWISSICRYICSYALSICEYFTLT